MFYFCLFCCFNKFRLKAVLQNSETNPIVMFAFGVPHLSGLSYFSFLGYAKCAKCNKLNLVFVDEI